MVLPLAREFCSLHRPSMAYFLRLSLSSDESDSLFLILRVMSQGPRGIQQLERQKLFPDGFRDTGFRRRMNDTSFTMTYISPVPPRLCD